MIDQQKAKTTELQDSIVGLKEQLAALSQEKEDLQAQVEQALKEGATNQQQAVQRIKAQNQQLWKQYNQLMAASRQSTKELEALLRQ